MSDNFSTGQLWKQAQKPGRLPAAAQLTAGGAGARALAVELWSQVFPLASPLCLSMVQVLFGFS